MTAPQRILLILRALVETGVVVGLAAWGVHAGGSTAMQVILGIGAPALGFGLWGAVDFHQADRFAEPLRLAQELILSLLAALALYAAGGRSLGIALGGLSIVYHALVYASGERLLKPNGPRPSTGPARYSEADRR